MKLHTFFNCLLLAIVSISPSNAFGHGLIARQDVATATVSGSISQTIVANLQTPSQSQSLSQDPAISSTVSISSGSSSIQTISRFNNTSLVPSATGSSVYPMGTPNNSTSDGQFGLD